MTDDLIAELEICSYFDTFDRYFQLIQIKK